MLKLVLQTQEGQQIEVTVSADDTFTDLQRQFESPENPNLPELLKHLITNGEYVDESMRVFDYVTNSSSSEWLADEAIKNINTSETVDTLQTIVDHTSIKGCCVDGCSNTELTVPSKAFFPLPTDKDRLSSWLIGLGKSELIDVEAGSKTEENHFVCADHFPPHQFLKGTNQVLKRRACPSLKPFTSEEPTNTLATRSDCPPKIVFVQSETIETETPLPQIKEENEEPNHLGAVDYNMLEWINDFKETTHPGVLCRLCGKPTFSPVYLYSELNSSNECSLADKINLCLPITVNAKDPLPKQVCTECWEKLEMCHELATKCLETEDRLKEMFELKEFNVKDTDPQECPLCVTGSMQLVTKSGIYRKDKTEIISESLSNSSARTRQVSPLRNMNNKIGSLSSTVDKEPLQGKSFQDEKISTDSPSYISQGELSCSLCDQKETSIESLTQHAKEHDGYPCTICEDVTFTTINEQQLHFLKHGVNDGYCEMCSIEWNNVKDAAEHIKICKPEVCSIVCADCGAKFSDFESGENHLCPTSELEEWFECDQCGKKFRQKSSLNTHMKVHEKRAIYYKCSFCNKQFNRKGSLHKHISMHHGDAESTTAPTCYKCRKCDEAFATAALAETHISEKHFSQLIMTDTNFISDEFTAGEINLARVYMCEYCERCYTIPSSLHSHRQTEHCENTNYQCKVCNNSFETYKSLVRHKSLHAKESELEDLGIKQYYLCTYCNKTFLHYTTLTSHMSQHQQPLPYLCRLCNFQFATYEEVSDHKKITHPYQSVLHERPNNLFHCQYCKKSFYHEVALIKHIRMHTGEKPYKCSVCGKGFSQTSGLYTHLKVHSDLRPYSCPQCPQTFKIKGDRDNHVKKHSGDRPYKCDFCKKAFMTQHVYSQHRRIHTDERPYKCDVCGEAFRRSHVLTVHMRRHTGEKPHVCDICSKAYRQRGDLLKHRKIQHDVGPDSYSNIASNSNTGITRSSDVSSTESTNVFPPV
ncbi:zinc finger protein 595-like isoform X2 [Athalia rosae]|uniref:zinc finger protein 595-like isoform X2 n=1 Tax=Athalia rosae TaxID=37344 RepID=UPI0020337140|nr:zinc finger protein 595-like isoform X2 [Athalia rosae]